MKKKMMNGLQKLSKAIFLPVLLLPTAGILAAAGALLSSPLLIELFPFMDNPVTLTFSQVLSQALSALFTRLDLFFAVGVASGLANRKKSAAGFIALIIYLIFIHAAIEFLVLGYAGNRPASLETGVISGIILGSVVALVHNRYSEKQFSSRFQLYSGPVFTFIILIPIALSAAVLFSFIHPLIQSFLETSAAFIQRTGSFGLFLYGTLERLLIPTGLHHLITTPFLYTSLGGSLEVGGQIFEGAKGVYLAEMANPSVQILSGSVIWDARGISKMFGLIGACAAIYKTADPVHKKKVQAVLIPAAATSFIAGITEPIEFTFMFISPILFIVHSILSGLSIVVLKLFDVRAIAPTGFLDFLIYNLSMETSKTRWPLFIAVGIAFFFIYYFIFFFLIKKLNLKTIGRDKNDQDIKLYSKKDYQDTVKK